MTHLGKRTWPESLPGVQSPFMLVLTEDLFITPRLEDVAQHLGCEVLIFNHGEILQGEQPIQRSIPLTEPLAGPDARLIRRLSESRPALILVDLTTSNIPWANWIQTIKTSAATRRIPILAFGPHMEKGTLQLARSMGADAVLTRGRLFDSLQVTLAEWLVVPDRHALESACLDELSEHGRHGLSLIQAGEYFEAHEVLEQAWLQAGEFQGYLYRGLLQVAVAYLHITRSNFNGAAKMLLRMRQWLDPLPDACCGVDVTQLRKQLEQLRMEVDEVQCGNASTLQSVSLQPIPLLQQKGSD